MQGLPDINTTLAPGKDSQPVTWDCFLPDASKGPGLIVGMFARTIEPYINFKSSMWKELEWENPCRKHSTVKRVHDGRRSDSHSCHPLNDWKEREYAWSDLPLFLPDFPISIFRSNSAGFYPAAHHQLVGTRPRSQAASLMVKGSSNPLREYF